MPIFSVVIPVYNNDKFLSQCLDSLFNQTFKDFELICVNDGSTDNSLKILHLYKNKDFRIKIINTENKGAGAARNKGLDSASGKYIIFLDSDDFFEPTMLEKCFYNLETSNVDFLVFHSDRYLNTIDSFVPLNTIQDAEVSFYTPLNFSNLNKNIFRVFRCRAWDKVYRTDFVRRNNLRFQELRTANDLLFVFSAFILAESFEILPDVFIHYRTENSDSLTNTHEKSWSCFYYALLAFRDFLIKNELYARLRKDFINFSLYFCLLNLNTIHGNEKKEMYNKLKYEWFDKLEISSENVNYFYNKFEFLQYLKIKNNSYHKYYKFDIFNAKEISKEFILRKKHTNKFSKIVIKIGVRLWTRLKKKYN